MWAWNDLDCGDGAEFRGGGGGGVETGFHCGDVAGEESGDKAGADFVPAGHFDVSGFEGCVGGFKEGDEALGFEDADCLFGHGGEELEVVG